MPLLATNRKPGNWSTFRASRSIPVPQCSLTLCVKRTLSSMRMLYNAIYPRYSILFASFLILAEATAAQMVPPPKLHCRSHRLQVSPVASGASCSTKLACCTYTETHAYTAASTSASFPSETIGPYGSRSQPPPDRPKYGIPRLLYGQKCFIAYNKVVPSRPVRDRNIAK